VTVDNLTAWTEADPESRRTVTASKVAVYRQLRGDSGGRVYTDIGAGRINGFSIDLEYTPKENSMGSGVIGSFFCICNELGDSDDFVEDYILFNHYDENDYPVIIIVGDASYDKSIYLSNDTTYYLTVSRTKNGTTAYCYIYSDSDRNTLIDTLSATVPSNATYRYLSISNDIDLGTYIDRYGTYDVENVDIGDLRATNIVTSLMW